MRNNNRIVSKQLSTNCLRQYLLTLGAKSRRGAGNVRLHLGSNFLKFLLGNGHLKKPSQSIVRSLPS